MFDKLLVIHFFFLLILALLDVLFKIGCQWSNALSDECGVKSFHHKEFFCVQNQSCQYVNVYFKSIITMMKLFNLISENFDGVTKSLHISRM